MAYRISDTQNLAPTDLSDSSDGLESDDGASDWGTDDGEAFITKSLFDASTHPTASQAIQHDEEKYGINVKNVISSLELDFYGSMRLINLVRQESLKPESVKALAASDPRLQDDQYLQPVIQEDPLLRKLDLDDIADETELGELSLESWSDDDEAGPSTAPKSTNNDAAAKELESARAEISRLRGLLQNTLQEDESTAKTVKGKGKIPAGRDDDTHYFDSYAENDIHEIMLKDTTRTISYAKFIMSNPKVFKGATVMDVGCGTGILSMLAAKAGAKHVYAIEASGLASKARENIKRNGYESVITVIQSKVENVTLPVKQVDVIISEWMGYMLLYESMLDSVLYARDQFLAPGGLMAPSQTRLVVSGVTCEQVWKDRVKFWDGVYGFDLTAMDKVYFDEGMVEVVEEDEIVTDDYVVRDINTHSATIQSLDFHSDFELNVKTDSTIRAFMTHFDTFFSPHGGADASHVGLDQTVDLTRFETAAYDKAVDAETTEETSVSFTTGPRGTVTHWRQVVFLLRSPIAVQKVDRRPVDPPPVVELQSLNTNLRELVESTSFFIRVSIVHPTPAQNGEYDIVRTPTGAEASTGEVIQTPERLNGLDGKPGAVVIFAKLSVRMPGVFRMKFTLYETSDFGITQITYAISDTFEVFSPKLFKGMKASTPLTRHLAAQGMKVKLRTDTTVGRQGTSRRRSGNISAPATRSNSPQASRITSPDQRSTGPRQTYNQPNVPLSLHTVRPLPTRQQRNVTVSAPPTVPARDRQLVWRPPMNRLVFNPLDGFDQDPGNTSNFCDDGLIRPIRDFPMRSDPLPTPPSADLSAFSLSNNSRRNSSHSNSRSDGIPPTLPYPGDRLNLRLGDDGIPTLPPIFSLPPLAMQSHPHSSSRLSNAVIFPSPILPPIQNYPLEDKNM